MLNLAETISDYVRETRKLESLPSSRSVAEERKASTHPEALSPATNSPQFPPCMSPMTLPPALIRRRYQDAEIIEPSSNWPRDHNRAASG
jgi:hypothetical protein